MVPIVLRIDNIGFLSTAYNDERKGQVTESYEIEFIHRLTRNMTLNHQSKRDNRDQHWMFCDIYILLGSSSRSQSRLIHPFWYWTKGNERIFWHNIPGANLKSITKQTTGIPATFWIQWAKSETQKRANQKQQQSRSSLDAPRNFWAWWRIIETKIHLLWIITKTTGEIRNQHQTSTTMKRTETIQRHRVLRQKSICVWIMKRRGTTRANIAI